MHSSCLRSLAGLVVMCSCLLFVGLVQAGEKAQPQSVEEVPAFHLAQAEQESMESRSATVADDKGWDIWGPITMRSADPEPLGSLEIKNIFSYGTSSDGSDDDIAYEFEVEYGIAPNHELIFAVPATLFDGEVPGNGDIELAWHWRLWKEQGLLPAFAMRNYIFIPSGTQSSGVDYELRGLLTKSIIPDQFRLHLNPFLKSVNGHTEEDHRYFQWGVIIGADYRLAENLVLNFDYIHEAGECEGERNQHTAEVGLDWHFAHNQGLGIAASTSLDGDSIGDNFGVTISYIYSFDGMPTIGR